MPTTATTTTTTTPQALPVGPRCTTTNLRGHYEEYLSASNQPSYFFTLVNLGARCTLKGYPSVQILDAAGKPAATAVERGSAYVATDPGPRNVTLAEGSKAWFTISSTGLCDKGTTTAPGSSAVLVIPPGERRQIKIPVLMSYCPRESVIVSAVASDRNAFMPH